VPVEEETAPASRAAQVRGELRAPAERQLVGDVAVARPGRRWFPKVDRGAQRLEPAREELLELLLLARRLVDAARRGVAGDELGRHAQKLVAVPPDGLDDLLFQPRTDLGHLALPPLPAHQPAHDRPTPFYRDGHPCPAKSRAIFGGSPWRPPRDARQDQDGWTTGEEAS